MSNKQLENISNFVKYNRNKLRLTQESLAEKAGVGLRFIRELEQGKETLRIDKINQVLALFGSQLITGSTKVKDPYEILLHYINQNVRIYLNNKNLLIGIILDSVTENNEIKAWKFVSNKNATKYKETEDSKLIEIIQHNTIESIENI